MSLDDIAALCRSNSTTTNPNCVCLSGGGPEMNTDISGPGVRISFYLQALFLGVISTRSQRLEERTSSLYMLICTNVALVITTFILGFRAEPEMSLHDAVIVFYLLGLSWTTIFFSVPAYNRFRRRDKVLQGFYILHSYLIFAFVLAVLIKAPTFGKTPLCNRNAVVVIFGDIPALSVGRVIAYIFVTIIIIVFTLLSVYDCKLPKQWKIIREWSKSRWKELREKKREDRSQTFLSDTPSGVTRLQLPRSRNLEPDGRTNNETSREKPKKKRSSRRDRYFEEAGREVFLTGVDGRLIVNLIIIFILWAIFVMNSELAIVHNHFDGGGDGAGSGLWGFGQIFPMLITVLPLASLFQAFKELGIQKRRSRKRVHKCRYRPRSGDEDLETGNGFSREFGFRPTETHRRPPRRPQRAYGDRRRTWANLGHHSGARISRTSLHSNDSTRYAEYVGEIHRRNREGSSQNSSDSEAYETAGEGSR